MREGKRCSGAIPYGFYLKADDKNTLYVDEEPARVVKQIFPMIIDGCGVNQIADTLTEQQAFKTLIVGRLLLSVTFLQNVRRNVA